MTILLPLFVGSLFGAGTWLLLGRSIVRQIIGLALIGHGANLTILLAGGVRGGSAPILGNPPPLTDPLPQALILTAIVIGFGVVAFLLALGYRMHAYEEDS
ncbi:MAG: NADH-quinone oxidoreductase subunit K [Armatimonadota bacterium]|nr:NADH-quinone oxidoreductase subunit K [Armatimonadota bacterium]MDR7438998.1 NADH-quinone oxidoreductase subunit K [Armatimonadota bacterium]MDR7563262.1 NADH-quinone oxidoreductase subunit K [Armatimonadota bacterium]MDR7566980.1 NADH-quinone oxidoreductase subunit K [Armatimonadota bacterium]MDR7602049.1 NADH-quinone oxidoreductase subunit K [Armatimonadota bacterium]